MTEMVRFICETISDITVILNDHWIFKTIYCIRWQGTVTCT